MNFPEALSISPDEEEKLNAAAIVPEHVIGLMKLVSRGEAYLMDDFLVLARDNWVILIGYPLRGISRPQPPEAVARRIVSSLSPEYLWFIGPRAPSFMTENIRESQSDYYYLLELSDYRIPVSLNRTLRRAGEKLTVRATRNFSAEHQELTEEFLATADLAPRVAALYRAMPAYVPAGPGARVLEARTAANKLSAYYVLDLAAADFTTYIIGCYSRMHYEPGASDLLMAATVELSRNLGKKRIHLGLGVNDGIRRFKEKWGGRPEIAYHFVEWHFTANAIDSLTQLLRRLFHSG